MDDDRDGGESEAFSVCSSPLSTALDTAVLEASSHATDGNTPSFNSEQSNGGYVQVDGKTYLAVDHTANLRKGAKPFWIWNHGDELRLLAGPKPKKNWRCSLCGIIIPVESTTHHAGSHLRKKHKIYEEGTEPTPRRSIGQAVANMAYHALVSTVQADRFRYLLICWIVTMHVALSIVEHDTFREMLIYICPALDKVLARSHNTIRR
jgi:hypothetical protein